MSVYLDYNASAPIDERVLDLMVEVYKNSMSMAHFMCVAGTGEFCSFEKGYHRIGSIIQTEKYQYLFQCAKESNDFDAFIKLAG